MNQRSAVAGILDRKGGLRVVVTQRWRMRHHVGKHERLFVVPGVEVKEPVPWDEIPPLVEKVQKHIAAKLAPVNHCGECKQCCILPLIDDPELQKPAFTRCKNLCSEGCKIYWKRPKPCSGFECMWLKSQSRNDRMSPELRPDRCGSYFSGDTTTNDPLIIEVHGTPNADAWKWIDEMQRVGYKCREVTHYMGDRK
jgi:hypothetical protein